ncbi:SH3 domain-containing protein [Streptomyces sp. NPDC003719]
MRKALLAVTGAAALLTSGLVGTVHAVTAPTAVGASACGKTYGTGYWWTYPTTDLKLRSGPGAGYAALGLLVEGAGVEVRCKAKKAGWLRVTVLNGSLEGRTGWVASAYIAE